MSYVEKLPSGRYRGGYRDARGRRRSRTFLHKAAARLWAQDGEDQVRRGMSPESGRLTVGEWVKRWQAARVVAPVTAYNEKGRVQVVVDEFGRVPLGRMSTLEIQGWEKRLAASGLSGGTVGLYHLTISAILKAAVQERLIPVNPAHYVTQPPKVRGREVYLTPAEVEAVAGFMSYPHDVAVQVQPYLGLRWGELIGLRVSDLDMLRRTVQVRQVIQEVSGKRTVKPYPKTLSSYRTVPIPPQTADILAAHLSAHPRGRGDLVFTGAEGRPLSRVYHARQFKEALTKAKVDKAAVPHDLRHSGASWMAQAGVSIFDISKWLGHASIQTTMRYVHAVEGQHDGVSKAMAALGHGTHVGQQVKDAP